MSYVDRPNEPHASDGVLLALHDEQHGADLESGRRHLDRCAECQARLNVIAAQATQVSIALAAIPTVTVSKDDLRRRAGQARANHGQPIWRRPEWLAAAALVLLVGAAAASPIRHWLRRRQAEPRIEHAPPQASVSPSAQPIDRSGATVSFAATGSSFTIRFDSMPAAGSLTARGTTSDQIAARVVTGAGTGGDAMVVLPNELLVRNSSGARAGYELMLPRVVTRLRVIVAERVLFDGAPPTTIPLDRSK
jgi:hypothetical protein